LRLLSPTFANFGSRAPVLAVVAATDGSQGGASSFGQFRMAAALGALALGGGLQANYGPTLCETTGSDAKGPEPTLTQKCMAEALGTGIIVHGGCGCICSKMYAGSAMGLFQIATIWGVSVALAIFATREVSGAHLNPAVSVSLAVNNDFSREDLPFYLGAQLLGATIAGAINYALTSGGIAALELAEKVPRGTCTSTFAGAFGMVPNAVCLGPVGAFMAEVLCTSILAFMIFTLTDADGSVPKDMAPILIGATVTAMITIMGPLTGCGMNPARDLGPRLVTFFAGWGSIAWSSWWIYTLGPITGAVLGGYVYNQFFKDLNKQPPEKK